MTNPIVELCAKVCEKRAEGWGNVPKDKFSVEYGKKQECELLAAAIRAITPDDIAVVAGEPLTAKEKYDKYMQDNKEPSAIERLRFFCSLAMNAPDWMDAAQFFDAIYAAPAVPEGMKLVPLEPTKEILDAAIAFHEKGSYMHHPDVRPWMGAANGDTFEKWNRDLARALYKAMLAACGEGK